MRISFGRILFAVGILLTLIVVSSTQSGVGGGGQSNVGGGGQGSGGGLPAGLTYVAPTLTVSTAGTGNGQLALSGNTSGTATFTAPGLSGGPVTMSNVLIGPNGSAGTDTYSFLSAQNTGMFNNSTAVGLASNGVLVLSAGSNLGVQGLLFGTLSNCSSSASPAVCAAAPAGSVAVPASSATLQVNTTAVTANSQIILTEDSSLGTRLSVTCNTTPTVQPLTVTARTGGSSFTFSDTAPTTNPRCVSYWIVN